MSDNLSKAQRLLLARIVVNSKINTAPLSAQDVDGRALPGAIRRGFVRINNIPVGTTGRTVEILEITEKGRIALDTSDRANGLVSGPTLLQRMTS